MQLGIPATAYVPDSHRTCSASSVAGHRNPGWHDVHAAAPPVAYEPAGHGSGRTFGVAHDDPAGQSTHVS